jgi:hypothetical protein
MREGLGEGAKEGRLLVKPVFRDRRASYAVLPRPLSEDCGRNCVPVS